MVGTAERLHIRRVAVFTGDIIAASGTPDEKESQPSMPEPSSIGQVARAALTGTVEQLGQERSETPPDMAA